MGKFLHGMRSGHGNGLGKSSTHGKGRTRREKLPSSAVQGTLPPSQEVSQTS